MLLALLHCLETLQDKRTTVVKEWIDAALVHSRCWWYCLGIGVVLVHVCVAYFKMSVVFADAVLLCTTVLLCATTFRLPI